MKSLLLGPLLWLLLGNCNTASAQISTPIPTPHSVGVDTVKGPSVISSWKNSFKGAFNMTESALSSNWRGGGVNSIGLSTEVGAHANYHRGRDSWDNEADFLYAFVMNKGQGYRKSLDRVFLDTKFGHNISQQWDTFLSLNVLTQMAPGYKYSTDSLGRPRAWMVSSAFAPAYITAAYGFEYRPTTYFKIRLSPFAPRLTIVSRSQRFRKTLGDSPYGVRPSHATYFEVLAAQVLAELDKNVMQNVTVKARYLLFANYQNLALRRIDHRLDAGFTAKVNRYINVSLTGIILYDYDQDRAIQYSQGLSLGLIYTWQNPQAGK